MKPQKNPPNKQTTSKQQNTDELLPDCKQNSSFPALKRNSLAGYVKYHLTCLLPSGLSEHSTGVQLQWQEREKHFRGCSWAICGNALIFVQRSERHLLLADVLLWQADGKWPSWQQVSLLWNKTTPPAWWDPSDWKRESACQKAAADFLGQICLSFTST